MKVDISIAELFDKISILEIKAEKIKDSEKLKNVLTELDLLYKTSNQINLADDVLPFIYDLRKVNEILWDIEDKIRVLEKDKDFGEQFIELARSVYFYNDQRSYIKRQLNTSLGSEIVEEKEYSI